MADDNSGIVFTHWDQAERLATAAGEAAAWRLGYDEDPVKPGFMHVRWGPNEGAPEHRHKSWTANVVLQGRLKIGDQWYERGAVALIEPIWRDLDDPVVKAMLRWDRETGKGNWR